MCVEPSSSPVFGMDIYYEFTFLQLRYIYFRNIRAFIRFFELAFSSLEKFIYSSRPEYSSQSWHDV